MSYDCQKNLLLPKLPDQTTYSSQQYSFYNFRVVIGSSKSKLKKDNVQSYCWNEMEYHKGYNEIASALYHRLTSSNLNGINTIRLISDGCNGQNRNTSHRSDKQMVEL